MQHSKMIVLGLLGQGMKYGLEMEKHIKTTRMRYWARIGSSTIYKALLDLQKDGSVTAKLGKAERGPGKTVYTLTKQGKKNLSSLVNESLKSDQPVYSDRITGMVFAMSLPPSEAQKNLSESIKSMGNVLSQITTEKATQAGHPIAQIVLDYYETVYAAEQKAMADAVALLQE